MTPSISLESTLTDNVDLSPADQRRSDWVNQITPAVRFAQFGPRTRLNGSISVPILLYARTSENNYVAPEASIAGTFEAVERFLFVDASAHVSQQYTTPFGARSPSLANATDNRHTAQTYTISPYIRNELPGGYDYELRNNNTWTIANAAAISGGRSYTNEVVGHIARAPAPGGWSLEYDRSEIKFEDQEAQRLEIVRGRALYLADPSLQISAIAGYEDNQFGLSEQSGATYGAGILWRPTDRTKLDGFWEHRFFGSSYRVGFDHRTPLTVWALRASRDITSYPQELARLNEGANVSGLLDSLFQSRVPDPIQRQALVDQIIRDQGLPLQLTGPVSLFSQQITLVESENATFGILGARNSIFFTIYHTRNQPVVGADPVGGLLGLVDTDQTGANVAWTHQVASGLTFGANADWSRTTSATLADASTQQYAVRGFFSQTLSTLTTLYGGARFQNSRSNVGQSYREIAVFVGLTYTFH